jgi:hypothetical protein
MWTHPKMRVHASFRTGQPSAPASSTMNARPTNSRELELTLAKRSGNQKNFTCQWRLVRFETNSLSCLELQASVEEHFI